MPSLEGRRRKEKRGVFGETQKLGFTLDFVTWLNLIRSPCIFIGGYFLRHPPENGPCNYVKKVIFIFG